MSRTRTRAASTHGLQHWLESQAAGPAFLIAAASVILRGAAFWSGGAISLPALLGTTGVQVFNGATGVGIAVGSELLASVFGRQWRRADAERIEATGRRGVNKAERAALVAHYAAEARLAKRFMLLGIVASLIAAAFFLVTTTGANNALAILAEVVIAGVLVAVMVGFGVFYTDRPDADAGELQAAQARTLRAGAVAAAGARVATGEYSSQDVRLMASALPRAERDQFEAALIVATPDDPLWSTAQLAKWLGCNDPAGRRALQRRLVRLKDAGAGIVKDERAGYRIPQSAVAMHFADQFLERHTSARAATAPGQSRPSGPPAPGATSDSDTTATGERQDAESRAVVASVVP